ncbi:hypothetical protein [Nocardioides abyssi]|uniref:Lipoprotein n=1 Tax=Nocardioides abyssi TaxID=3058370 RepID=A0ABT8EQX6_9ACTN|nr:hypothetical protein [Nocardioides abyssi]MDN4160552.1 hypothetical protein [Nocardioides abyssi]
MTASGRLRTLAAAAALASLATLAACGSSGGAASEPTAPPEAPASTPAASSSAAPEAPGRERAELPLPGGSDKVGEWEDGPVAGEVVVLRRVGPYDEVLYAAGSPAAVAVGLRDGDRVLRTITTSTPEGDAMHLYGGERMPDGTFRVVGAVPGDVAVTVGEGSSPVRPATGASDQVLPGWTVFHEQGPWDDRWDPLQLAPLTITTDDGRSVDVRRRSWTG